MFSGGLSRIDAAGNVVKPFSKVAESAAKTAAPAAAAAGAAAEAGKEVLKKGLSDNTKEALLMGGLQGLGGAAGAAASALLKDEPEQKEGKSSMPSHGGASISRGGSQSLSYGRPNLSTDRASMALEMLKSRGLA